MDGLFSHDPVYASSLPASEIQLSCFLQACQNFEANPTPSSESLILFSAAICDALATDCVFVVASAAYLATKNHASAAMWIITEAIHYEKALLDHQQTSYSLLLERALGAAIPVVFCPDSGCVPVPSDDLLLLARSDHAAFRRQLDEWFTLLESHHEAY